MAKCEHSFLGELTREQLTLLTDRVLAAHFKAGELIFREGEHADRF